MKGSGVGQDQVQHRRKADQRDRSPISTTPSLQVGMVSPSHPKKPTLHNDEITLFSHKGNGSIFLSAFYHFAAFTVKRNSLCRWSVGMGVLQCLCKHHVILPISCIFSHSRPAIFLSVPSSGKRKKHLEATGDSRVVWKAQGCGRLYRNTSSVKADAIRNCK